MNLYLSDATHNISHVHGIHFPNELGTYSSSYIIIISLLTCCSGGVKLKFATYC